MSSEDEWQMEEQEWGWVFYGVHDSTLHTLVTSGEGASEHLSTSMYGTPEDINTNIVTMKEPLLPQSRPIAQPKVNIIARWVFCIAAVIVLLVWVRLLRAFLKMY